MADSGAVAPRIGMGMPKTPQEREKRDEIELHPDAWERFTEFVKRIAKAGPQHRAKKGTAIEQGQDRRKGHQSNNRGGLS